MQDYSSYSFKGFWFQPDYIPMEEAKPFGNNGFLKKYWNEDSFSQNSSSNTSMFENYFNFDFDGYSQNVQNGSYQNSGFNSYFNNINSNNTSNTNSFSSYEQVLNNFYSQIGYTNNSQTGNKSSIVLDNNYNSYFNSIFS